MLISKKWLSEFVKIPNDISDEDLAKKVTLSTVEVERVIDQSSDLEGMVLGLVKSVSAHPNADRLKVCKVDIGDRTVQIVCGGTNVKEGMKVAVALPGSRVRWHGEGDWIELVKTNIRGEESEGMICAAAEIGMETRPDDPVGREGGELEREIMDVSDLSVVSGTPLAQALGRDDVIFEIEHKSLTNRPDLMGHYGMAREIAALYRITLEPYAPPHAKEGKGIALSVEVKDASHCPRYLAMAVEDIVVGPSPAWLCDRLLSSGVRSVNNVVDVTNYVMLETGQPMHAFDASAIGGDAINIVVRSATKDEKIHCLDEKVYELNSDDLLITDGTRPIAIAGVMGGKESAVTNATTRILFESANFSPVSVRKTSMKLALRSESSARFEKSLDPEQCESALHRAVALLKESCPNARVVSEQMDMYPKKLPEIHITLSGEEVEKHLGTEISFSDIKDILTRLGFSVSGTAKALTITVPSWRATKDISIKEDVVEEIARIWGYDRIPSELPAFSIAPPWQDPVRVFSRRARSLLATGLGVTEVYRYAFVSPELLTQLGFDLTEHLKLANPLAADRPFLVRSLLPNLFETIVLNHRKFSSVSLFEIDRVFFGEREGDEDGQGGTLPDQPYHLAMGYLAERDEMPLLTLRHQVECVLHELGLPVSFRQMREAAGWMHPARAAEILVNGKKFGILAEALPSTSEALGIRGRVAVAEMNLSMLANEPRHPKKFTSIPLFPSVKRDLAFVIDERVAYANIEPQLRSASTLLESVELFDVFQGEGIEQGKKSMAVHVSFRAADRTLEAEEVEREIETIRQILIEQFQANFRS